MRKTGHYEESSTSGERVEAFVPAPLPPADPPLSIEGRIAERLTAAEAALSRLDLASEIVPSLDWFIYGFVRKEAVLSSQIEGTQATLMDLLAYEAALDAEDPVQDTPDIEEICNYLDALAYARRQLHDASGLPISMRLLNETHRRLMSGVRGATKQPGAIRQSQNWIGGSRPGNAAFVPPPPGKVSDLFGDLERYIHQPDDLPPLVRAGLVHVQFETIHPYLDGNGRIGRLLISLLLEDWGLLSQPLLYLSVFFKHHQTEYYRRLAAVRTEGDWEGWTDFFLDGVAQTADEAIDAARSLARLIAQDRERLLAADIGSLAPFRLFEALARHPIVTAASACNILDISKPTALKAIDSLEQAGILVETTGRKRDRSYAYAAYLDRLKAGTELNAGTNSPLDN